MNFNKFKNLIFDIPIIFDVFRWTVMGSYNPMFNNSKTFINAQKDEKILEIGCGTGIFSHLFRKNYTGIDFFPGFIKKAKEKNPSVNFQVMDAMNMTFQDKEFDKVLIFNFLHHMNNKQFDKIIKESLRIGKKIYIMEPIEQPFNPIAWMLYHLDRGAYIRKFSEIKLKLKRLSDIEKTLIFRSFIYKLVLIEIKDKTPNL